MYSVRFPTKLTSANFEDFNRRYYKASFAANLITFDFGRLEWIAIEQITFVISWINTLVDAGISVAVNLQTTRDIRDKEDVLFKREQCFNYLLVDWRLSEMLDPKVTFSQREFRITRKVPKPIPYHEIGLIRYQARTFDNDFDELYDTHLKTFVEYIEQRIKSDTLLNYFDNHFLHYSIIKEFFSNTCQHAFSEPAGKSCFFSMSSNNKIEKLYGEMLRKKLEERFQERPEEERDFFRKDGNWLNESFIEFNFLDFGKGISKTLREKYQSEDFSELADKLSSRHLLQNEDTRVLEYAFLLFTSKYELADDLSLHNYIPRGLFIIKDVVKRYGGMIIARSCKGKVVYNFKYEDVDSQIIYRADDDSPEIGEGFSGTSFTIVLPAQAKKKDTKKKQVNSGRIPGGQKMSFFNILKYTTAIELEMTGRYLDETEKRVRFLEGFFKNIVTDFLKINNKSGDLILLDFAGVERNSQDIFSKFLYFLVYCPLVSELKNIVLFNLLDKGIKLALLESDDEKLRSKGFMQRTIPCIFSDNTVKWIGVDNPELEEQLSLVWNENLHKNSTFHDLSMQANNVLAIDYISNGATYFSIRIKPFRVVIKSILKFQKEVIDTEFFDNNIRFPELISNEHNYNTVLTTKFGDDGKQRAFLTANGKYQREFLTFIEKLYIREYRRLIATYLLFKLFANCKTEYDTARIEDTDKILTVTLSSQLLGKEFTDILNSIVRRRKSAHLIPLSNYYDFNNEAPFKEINPDDTIIVVNDVISTGNLSQKLADSVKTKNADIVSILAIVDSRSEVDRAAMTIPISALTTKEIPKHEQNPFDSTPVWINPILNAPTTMSREKSNIESVLKTPQEFINLFKDDRFFKVGYFQQNTRYLTYYLQTNQFFKEEQESGFVILKQIVGALENKILSERGGQHWEDLADLKRIHIRYTEQLRELCEEKQLPAEELEGAFSAIEGYLAQIGKESATDTTPAPLIDFIFYPFLSSVSEIEKNINPIAAKLRGNQTIEIYPLPRIMTPRGWRFSFPPKFLNFRTKNKTALILDDGSCTGETIYQMIDSLSFLELKEIFVLSIFGRLEDFQREFLSRIKLLRVKDKNKIYKQIPVTVYFGTHFHIPVYSKSNSPAAQELEELAITEAFYERKRVDVPAHIAAYFKLRREQIGSAVNPDHSNEQFSLIPERINKRLMFFLRDITGNFDSYRLFKEDEMDQHENGAAPIYITFKELLAKDSGKDALLAVITMEPFLTNSINRLYPEVLSADYEDNTRSFAIKQLFAGDTVEGLYFYLVSLVAIDVEIFCNTDFLRRLLLRLKDFGDSATFMLNYIAFLFTSLIFQTRKNVEERISNLAILTIQKLYFDNNSKTGREEFYASLLKELYNDSLTNVDDFPGSSEVTSIRKIQTYYKRQFSIFDGWKEANHPNIYIAISSKINELNTFLDQPPPEERKYEIANEIDDLCSHIEERLLTDLRKVLAFLQQFFDNFDLGLNIPKYRKNIEEFDKLRIALKNKRKFITRTIDTELPAFITWLLNFQSAFFKHTTPLPMFFNRDRSNVNKVINQSVSKHENATGELNLKIVVPDDLFLAMHPYLLGMVFWELARNKVKYALQVKATITATIDKNHVHLLYHQKLKFREKSNENGLITIRNIIKQYGGKTVSRSDKETYEFEIVLNKDLIIPVDE